MKVKIQFLSHTKYVKSSYVLLDSPGLHQWFNMFISYGGQFRKNKMFMSLFFN